MPLIEIYGSLNCPFVHRTRLVLLEKDIDFHITIIDTKNKPERFLEISPYGKIPVMLHDEVRVYESAVINEYLDEVFPEPALMPENAERRAMARIWIDYCNTRLIGAMGKLRKSEPGDDRDALREKLSQLFLFMEYEGLRKLSDSGPYWLGEKPSLVDFTYYPHIERMAPLIEYRGFKIPTECARFKAWYETIRLCKSVKQTITPGQDYIERYKNIADPAIAAE